MALHFYHDAAGTQEITEADVDHERLADVVGSTIISETQIYIGSDDPNLTYENIVVSTVNDFDNTSNAGEIDIEYALDSNGSPGTYNQILNVPNNDFDPPVPIWRKMTAPNITTAFTISNIEHHIENYDEYVK
jgi:hypothetical protein